MSNPERSDKFEVWDSLLNGCKNPIEKINMELMIAGITFRVNTDLARSFLTNGSVDNEKIEAFVSSYKISADLRQCTIHLVHGFLKEKTGKKISAKKIQLKNDEGIWSDLTITLISNLQIPSGKLVPIARQINKLRADLSSDIASLIVDGMINEKRIRDMVINSYDFPKKVRELIIKSVREAVRRSAEAIEE